MKVEIEWTGHVPKAVIRLTPPETLDAYCTRCRCGECIQCQIRKEIKRTVPPEE